MTQEYALLDPRTGTYTRYNNLTELRAALTDLALELLLAHTHNSPYSIVTINPDGTETWRSSQITVSDLTDPDPV